MVAPVMSLIMSRIEVSRPPGVLRRMIKACAPVSCAEASASCMESAETGFMTPSYVATRTNGSALTGSGAVTKAVRSAAVETIGSSRRGRHLGKCIEVSLPQECAIGRQNEHVEHTSHPIPCQGRGEVGVGMSNVE